MEEMRVEMRVSPMILIILHIFLSVFLLSVPQGYQRSNHFIATQGECTVVCVWLTAHFAQTSVMNY